MPSTRLGIDHPIPGITQIPQPFKFPDSTHLLITTPRHVFAWDASGVQPLFRSRRGSIVAAREAKDGSGILVVASSNVVVLHDTKRGKQESWGLNANQDEVRFLEYGPDARSLFLTTTSDGAIQHYSTERSRLLEPVGKLATVPAALAVSATGHLILSASQDPPVVHLKNLTLNSASLRIHPNASSAPISCAAFHPERPNVFLLAFRDGTVAAYDATRMPKRDLGVHADPGLKDGEIGHLSNLHRGMLGGDYSLDESTLAAPIVGIAFLPGFKTRAVTAGRDGRCKIIDFAHGGEVLRTWHAKAPLTSISVVAIKSDITSRSARSSRRSQGSAHTIGGPTSTESLIAIGRVDGKVQIYDTVGLMLTQKAVAGQEERILSVEWVKGDSPRTLDDGGIERHFSNATATAIKPRTMQVPQEPTPPAQPKETQQTPKVVRSTRKLVIHPDEMEEEGTVRHKPAARNAGSPIAAIAGYQDLFSPVKPETVRTATQEPISSPRRRRPRLSSQTFIKSPQDIQQGLQLATPRGLTVLKPVESSESMERRRRKQQTVTSARRTSKQVDNSARRISFAQTTIQPGDGTVRILKSAVSNKASANAKVLADLRRLAQPEGTKSQRNQGTLSSYTASHRQRQVSVPESSQVAQSRPQHLQDLPKKEHAQREVHVSNPDTWPTDSIISSLVETEDIWFTSDSSDDTASKRRHKARAMGRPPGRQTSRSKVDHTGSTMSTTISHAVSHRQRSPSHVLRVDVSTEEEMFSATSRLSPTDAFSPASEDVRELFPRSSSLSPRRHASPRRRKTQQTSPERKGLALTAMSLNQALGRQPKSPWAKAKAVRRASSPRKNTNSVQNVQRSLPVVDPHMPAMEGLVRLPSDACLTCPETKARVQGLENEVAILKGEVLAMKAILRRNGLPFPACLR